MLQQVVACVDSRWCTRGKFYGQQDGRVLSMSGLERCGIMTDGHDNVRRYGPINATRFARKQPFGASGARRSPLSSVTGHTAFLYG